jgi:MFS family permease
MNPGSKTSRPVTAESAAPRLLRTTDLLILSIGAFTLGVDGFVLSGLLPQVAASLHVSASTAGQLTTLFALVYAVSSPVIAALAGAWDRRALLAAGLAVFTAGMIVQATGPDFGAVAAGRVLAALGAAGYQATAYSTAGILSDDAHRARSLAVVAGGSSAALVAGLPFGILVGQTWGWRAAMWVLVALAVAPAVAVWRLPAARAPRLSLRERGQALADPRVLGILAGTVTVLTPVFLIIAYLPAIMRASGAWIVTAMLAYGAGQVAAMRPVAGETQLIVHQPVPQLVGGGGGGQVRPLRGEREAGQGRDDHRERVAGIAAVPGRRGQAAGQPGQLQERARPAVRQHDRQRPGRLRLESQVEDVSPVQRGGPAGQRVDPGLDDLAVGGRP